MDVRMRWHRLSLKCKKCNLEMAIQNIHSSADGEILIESCCVKCALQVKYVSSLTKMMADAIFSDIEESMAKKNPKEKADIPVRPPLASPTEKILDDKFFHDLGIDPNDPKQIGGGQ